MALTPSMDLVWSQLIINMRDQGPSISTSITFENPTPLTLKDITGMEFYLSLEGTRIIRIYIQTMQLKPKVQDLTLNINIDLLGDLLDPLSTRAAIESASSRYATHGDFEIGLSGPFGIKDADFVHYMTEPFEFKVSLKDAMELFASNSSSESESTSNALSSILNSLISFKFQ